MGLTKPEQYLLMVTLLAIDADNALSVMPKDTQKKVQDLAKYVMQGNMGNVYKTGFDIVTEIVNEFHSKIGKGVEEKKNITVVRYIRPTPWETNNTNLYGITIEFHLDYETRTVGAKWTVCSGDNFSKKTARDILKNRKTMIQFPMSEVERCEGLIPALIGTLDENFSTYSYFGMEALFSKTLRKLNT